MRRKFVVILYDCTNHYNSERNKALSIVGVQNEPPQYVPQWYADYLELKAILTTVSRETSALPFNYYL